MPRSDCVNVEIALPELKLAARARGPETKRPVLALHGWLDNAASFDRLAPLLPDWRIVALDLPGHGHSDHRPAGCRYHFFDYLDDVLAVADVSGWQRFDLLGHSLGAAIAGCLAAAVPERVGRLMLIDGLGPLSEPPEQLPVRLARALNEQQRPPNGPRVYSDIEQAVRARQRATGLSPETARILVERGIRTVPGGVTWRSDPRLLRTSPSYMTEEQVRALLAAIRAPTLLIKARDGFLRKRPSLAGRLSVVPTPDVVELPGGHHLHLEDPEPVAEVLRGWRSGGEA